MLQQTQVQTVIPYYQKFLSKFPDVESLADADENDVLKSWEGLGYYSRARNLHRSAKEIKEKYESDIPSSKETIEELPGFGPYTSAAVLSIAYNKKHAVVDGNVIRVISRLFGIKEDVSSGKVKTHIQEIVDNLIPEDTPSNFNEAMMELGATICHKQSPNCKNCPVNSNCYAYKNAETGKIPYKAPKAKVPQKRQYAFIYTDYEHILIQQRSEEGLLAKLWEFPNSEDIQTQTFGTEIKLKKIQHVYSHFKLEIKPYIIVINKKFPIKNRQLWVKISEKENYAFHKAHDKIYLEFLKNC